MKKGFLFAVSICLLMGSLTGCKSHSYSLKSKIQKTTLSESAIQNISKYKAIGVGTIDKSSPQKRYKFIDKEADDANNTNDYTYNLLGMTENGLIEELTFLANNGSEVKSSNFNITYYNEIGDDFVLFSYLPMDVKTYINGYKNWMKNEYEGMNKEQIEQQCYYMLTGPINKLRYHLMWSIKTSKGFIDTSFLVHKSSGKVFPFSMHRYYVDPKKIYGVFQYSLQINDDETNLTAADMMFQSVGQDYISHYDELLSSNYFENGFFVSGSCGVGSFGTYCEGTSILTFDEQTQNIIVDSFTAFSIYQNACDKWGNAIVSSTFSGVYNLVDKKIKSLDVFDGMFDPTTRQFYKYDYVYDDNGFEEMLISFYDEDLEIEYSVTMPYHFWFNITSPENDAWIDKKEKICWLDNDIIKVNLDENEHYAQPLYTVISSLGDDASNIVFAYGDYYYLKDNAIYKVDTSNNYECIKLAEVDYRINSLYLNDFDNLTFSGLDLSTLQEVTGYITPDDEVTFEINTNSNKTTIFTPIN